MPASACDIRKFDVELSGVVHAFRKAIGSVDGGKDLAEV